MADCWICNAEADKWNHPEARLCTNCWSRGTDGLRALDFGIVDKGASVEVEAPPQHAPIIELVFREESFGSLVKKLVKKELQIGSQQIDDKVYFETASESDLPYLRGFEASQLMATLCDFGGVEIANGRALLHLIDGSADKEKATMLTASLLHFIRHRQNMSHG